MKILEVVSEFSHTIRTANSEHDVCRLLSRHVLSHLNLEDCVIYLHDPQDDLLHQVAAFGSKNAVDFGVVDPITIRPGYGIVGSAFSLGKPELVNDTRLDPRYIIDDQMRLSELAVPIYVRNGIAGVIDSEHSGLSFYTQEHLSIFQILAAVAGNKIEQIRAMNDARRINEALESKSIEILNKNKELEALNAQMDDLIYSITHDFRTPILASLGISDMMAQEGAVFKDLHPMLKSSLSKLDGILQSVHLFYRVKRRLVVMSDFSLYELVSSIIESNRQSFNEKFLVRMDIDEGIMVKTDSYRMGLILDQLFKNAVLFAYRPQQENFFDMKAHREQNRVVLTIEDYGPGVPEGVLRSSTNLLRKGHAGGKGIGLGLSIVYEAATSAGMNVKFRNRIQGGLAVEISMCISED